MRRREAPDVTWGAGRHGVAGGDGARRHCEGRRTQRENTARSEKVQERDMGH